MWALRDETELAQQVEQPILFINMEAFQTPENLASMKLFLTDHIERRVVTIKYTDSQFNRGQCDYAM